MQDAQIIENKNENIEILRAVAILLVLLVHLRAVLAFESSLYSRLTTYFDGNTGVDLFFVISGFVITRSLSHSFSSDHAPRMSIVVAFWIKRLFRLLPAASFWLLVVVLYLLAIGELWDGHQFHLRILIPVAASYANVLNLYSAYCVANPADTLLCKVPYFYGHYWSLSLEEQFYLVFPFIFIFLRKRVLICLMAILIAVQFFWVRPYWTYAWFFRPDGFCWGILLALLPVTRKNIPVVGRFLKNKMAVLMLSFLLIFLLPFSSTCVQGFGSHAKTYGIALLAAISAAMVFLAVRNEACFGTWLPYRRLMLYIGSRSYSIYITHLIVFTMARHSWSVIFGDAAFSGVEKKLANMAIVILSLVTIMILSEITYRTIELRFRLKGKELAKQYLSRHQTGVLHA